MKPQEVNINKFAGHAQCWSISIHRKLLRMIKILHKKKIAFSIHFRPFPCDKKRKKKRKSNFVCGEIFSLNKKSFKWEPGALCGLMSK